MDTVSTRESSSSSSTSESDCPTPVNPVTYVAPELWVIIFNKLKSHSLCENVGTVWPSSDLLSCSQVCTTFQNILQDTKVEWLFQEVISLLTPVFAIIYWTTL